MKQTLSGDPNPVPNRDRGRFVGGWIYLAAGLSFAGVAGYLSRQEIQDAWNAVEWRKVLWCLAFACVGFAFDAFKASTKVGRKTGAWPLYLRVYFPLLILVAFFDYCAIEVYTSDKSHFFYGVSALLALALGYHADQLARNPAKLIPGGSD